MHLQRLTQSPTEFALSVRRMKYRRIRRGNFEVRLSAPGGRLKMSDNEWSRSLPNTHRKYQSCYTGQQLTHRSVLRCMRRRSRDYRAWAVRLRRYNNDKPDRCNSTARRDTRSGRITNGTRPLNTLSS